MNRIKSIFFKLRQQKKYSASNPANFEEIWSFNATGIQLISLIALVLLVVGLLVALLAVKGPFVSYFSKNDTSIERKKLEKQYREISKLTKEIDAQEAYIESIKLIVSGKIIEDSISTDIPDVQSINLGEIQTEQTENENELSAKVKADLRTNSRKKSSVLHYFVEPVKGVISQPFDLENHPAVDIVTEKDKNIVACLSGTIIYAGFTQKDGFVIVLDHSNGFLSVYKHAKTLLKKMGAKVQMSDPIAIVGNTGENSTGPHLHFELWYNQSVVNPADYMKFEK
jgi:murein DD-endopeptidase MepM/ murein hydrolase activator NlpD